MPKWSSISIAGAKSLRVICVFSTLTGKKNNNSMKGVAREAYASSLKLYL